MAGHIGAVVISVVGFVGDVGVTVVDEVDVE